MAALVLVAMWRGRPVRGVPVLALATLACSRSTRGSLATSASPFLCWRRAACCLLAGPARGRSGAVDAPLARSRDRRTGGGATGLPARDHPAQRVASDVRGRREHARRARRPDRDGRGSRGLRRCLRLCRRSAPLSCRRLAAVRVDCRRRAILRRAAGRPVAVARRVASARCCWSLCRPCSCSRCSVDAANDRRASLWRACSSRIRSSSAGALVACSRGPAPRLADRRVRRGSGRRRSSSEARAQIALIDTGPDPAALAACLGDLGVDRIDLLVLTHFDLDHYRRAQRPSSGASTSRSSGPSAAQRRRDRRSRSLTGGARVHDVRAGPSGLLGDLRWSVLVAARSLAGIELGNPSSIAVELEPVGDCSNGCLSALFLGDLGEASQARLLALERPRRGRRREGRPPRVRGSRRRAVCAATCGRGAHVRRGGQRVRASRRNVARDARALGNALRFAPT